MPFDVVLHAIRFTQDQHDNCISADLMGKAMSRQSHFLTHMRVSALSETQTVRDKMWLYSIDVRHGIVAC